MTNLSDRLNFTCTQCGECCKWNGERAVILFPDDIARLADGLGVSESQVVRDYCRPETKAFEAREITLTFLRDLNGACVFLDQSNKCTIHAFKPEQCKRTPFGFLWDGERSYACMETVFVPEDHATVDDDASLFQSLFLSRRR